ncbi:MAG: polyprenol monophosphomannose synthase [Planctomycetota bacterium]
MPVWRPLVVLPTFNEIENLPLLLEEIQATVKEVEVLVVDDASPDGTGTWVERQGRPGLHLLARKAKLGLGTAYRAGWHWGLERGFDPIVTMDADFSHHPRHLPAVLDLVRNGADLGIGSRYVPGGGIRNWPLHRRILSHGANLLSRFLLRLPVRDATAGFRAYRARVLQAIEPDSIRAEGYSFLEETLWRVAGCGFRCEETPIVFEDRRLGKSKISRAEIFKAAGTLLRLRCSRVPRSHSRPE